MPDQLDAAVLHLYEAAGRLMKKYTTPFVPLEVVCADLEWDDAMFSDVVDACVQAQPVVFDGVVADWMFDGDRPAYGRSGVRFIGLRQVPREPA